MTSSKSTKRALVSSALAIIMCVAMLIGATFAWFTDTASTGSIRSRRGIWMSSSCTAPICRHGRKPPIRPSSLTTMPCGSRVFTQVVYLKIVNAGNLALKYEAGFSKTTPQQREKC